MKIYLIAALFLAALVVAHTEDAENVELRDQSEEESIDPAEEDNRDVQSPGTEGDTEDVQPPVTEGDTEESEDEEVEDEEEEEDPEKRRRRNVLSSFSCLQIKRRGYCRHVFIRNLCAATCFVAPQACRDRLSRVSCLKLRSYPKCNTYVGRTYCRRTCSHCGLPISCRSYTVLNQLNRRQSRSRGNTLLCDQRGFATRWYRFMGAAGSKMPTRAPPKNRCGTHAPGWMVGGYPRVSGHVVRRKVCYHWDNNRCRWHNYIRVMNCGRYFVFYLRPTPVCHLRYCGNA